VIGRQVFQSTPLTRGATSASVSTIFVDIPFQSTPLTRGATSFLVPVDTAIGAISIHAPHARSDSALGWGQAYHGISIHAPHARSDQNLNLLNLVMKIFQSTPLTRGATYYTFCFLG